MNLATLDTNLLISLDVLLEERSVTAAARRRGVTQSAMSQALARLRTTFDDRLLVRVGAGMEPTPRAQQLAAPLRQALTALQAAISLTPSFTPASESHRFRIATTDYVAHVLVPPLLEDLQRRAPQVDLDIRPVDDEQLGDQLERGMLDVAIGVFRALDGDMRQRTLFDESFVGLARHGHPLLANCDLAAFCDTPQLLVAPRGRPGSTVDRQLAERGLTRRVAVRVPYFLTAPAIVAASDIVTTLPARIGHDFARSFGLCTFTPPLPVGGFAVRMAWHLRYDNDPALSWLRERVVAVAETL